VFDSTFVEGCVGEISPPPWNVGVIHLWEVDRKLPVYEIKEL
jgi:hypothetical protein